MEAGFTITKQGWKLLAKLLAGDKLEISKIMVGSGKVPEELKPGEITALVQPVALATSTVPQVADKQVSFIVEYRSDLNGGLQEGFWLNEFGVFANDPDDGEILLYYATMGDYPQYVAAYNGQAVDVRRYPVVIALSECYNVELKPPAGAWVTFEELAETLKRRGYHSNPNLLINWDFRNPVNRNGKSEYTGAGYTIDKWAINGNGVLTLENNSLKLVANTSSNFDLTYNFKNYSDYLGKQITVSLLAADNKLYDATGTFRSLTSQKFDGKLQLFSAAGFADFIIRLSPSNNISIVAVKIELGDQQTLAHQDADGNWILNDPPNYDLQYALCSQYSPITGEFVGSQHSNPNLLDNWYFVDPINQRNQDEYTGTGYTIDRWTSYGLKVNVNDNNLTLTNIGDGVAFGQLTEKLWFDKELTFSALFQDGKLATGTGKLQSGGHWSHSTLYQDNNARLWIQNRTDDFNVLIDCQSASIQLIAAKLELGPVQTLAHKEGDTWVLNDPPPNKALELAKCQRYLKPILPNFYYAGWVNQSGTIIHFACYYSELRSVPVVVVISPMSSITLENNGQRIELNSTDFTYSPYAEHLALTLTDTGKTKVASIKGHVIGCFSNSPSEPRLLLSAEI